MAVKINGKLVSDKERKQLEKTKVSFKKTKDDIWRKVWFLNGLELYEGVIKKEIDNGHYVVEARNKNIHKNGELQACIIPKRDVRFI